MLNLETYHTPEDFLRREGPVFAVRASGDAVPVMAEIYCLGHLVFTLAPVGMVSPLRWWWCDERRCHIPWHSHVPVNPFTMLARLPA